MVKKLTFDLESRSKIDLTKAGMYRYAEDESTEIFCFAFKFEGQESRIWIPDKFLPLLHKHHKLPLVDKKAFQAAVNEADIIEAHNVGFEASMWREIMVKRHGFRPLAPVKLRCSAAKAASLALPRGLGKACTVMHTEEQKDVEGYKIMLKMCKPRRPSKNNPSIWHENPIEFVKLCRYCVQDIVSEESLSNALPELPESELEIFRLDQTINERGIAVDLPAVNTLIDRVQIREIELLEEIKYLTYGKVRSVKQVAASRAWLLAHGLETENLQKTTVEELLKKEDLRPVVRRFLEIRTMLGMASVAKLIAMDTMACHDRRVRGALLYHGASTGRFSGKGIQPQNFPRVSYGPDEVDSYLSLDRDVASLLYDGTFKAASKCLRGLLIAGPGLLFIAADYSSIEARVLAWLAGEKKDLEAFRKGLDVYKITAADIEGVKYEAITKDQRQIGKVAVLSLGYQGWIDAFNRMGVTYGVTLEEERAKRVISAWRRNHPKVVALWKGLELAAIMAIKTGKPHAYGRIKFGIKGRFLHMRLPNGRLLSYCDPSVREVVDKYGRLKNSIRFMAVDSTTYQWKRHATYGGKICENCIQAVSRDLLTHGMLEVERAGYPIVFHVHDEIISEINGARNTPAELKRFETLMSKLPPWAAGIPLKAEGWVGKRYRK